MKKKNLLYRYSTKPCLIPCHDQTKLMMTITKANDEVEKSIRTDNPGADDDGKNNHNDKHDNNEW